MKDRYSLQDLNNNYYGVSCPQAYPGTRTLGYVVCTRKKRDKEGAAAVGVGREWMLPVDWRLWLCLSTVLFVLTALALVVAFWLWVQYRRLGF